MVCRVGLIAIPRHRALQVSPQLRHNVLCAPRRGGGVCVEEEGGGGVGGSTPPLATKQGAHKQAG